MNPWDSMNKAELVKMYTERFNKTPVEGSTKRALYEALNPPVEQTAAPPPAEQPIEPQQPTEPSPPAPDLIVTSRQPLTKVEAQEASNALAEIERLRKALAEATERAKTQVEPLKVRLTDIESEIEAAETALKSLRDQRDALRSQIASLTGKAEASARSGSRGPSGASIEVNGVVFNSPTGAAQHFRKQHGALSAVNGNTFWGLTGAEPDGFTGEKVYQGQTLRFRVIRAAA